MASLRGHLHLVAAHDPAAGTYLREQSFRAPFHLSKPHEEAGLLVVQVVNPTAGVFAGDALEMRVTVEGGARLLLTAPSAQRLHAMSGGEATLQQEFRVAAGGWLESWPELLIPQRGSNLRQRTEVHVEPGGGMLLIETMAPGRVAAGEVFAFERFEWTTDLRWGDDSIARERAILTPDQPALRSIRRHFPAAYFASVFAVAPALEADLAWLEKVRALHGDAAWIGASPLVQAGFAIRVIARDSLTLRRVVGEMRSAIYAGLSERLPAVRRN